jgi:hypothetical protein
MSILILGSEGSMGKRYQAILKFLNQDYVCKDKIHSEFPDEYLTEKIDGVIIATPTDTHLELIQQYLRYGVPILCEKPVTKHLAELKALGYELRSSRTPFRMMYQYQCLDYPTSKGVSWYDYFRHGNDGLVWDCLQVIGLARGAVNLAEESPIWDCSLNGKALSLSQMDLAYIDYVKGWLNCPSQDYEQIWDAHVKTHELARSGRYGRST